MRTLLDELGPAASKAVRDGLIEGLALGQNPREIARRIKHDLGGDLVRALRISRTETLRSYREATRRNYQANSDIIAGWRWLCAKQARTCCACLAMDGSFHTLDEHLDDHVNGRCCSVPVLKGEENAPPSWQTGSEWLDKSNEDIQRQVLGNAAYEAWSAGQLSLGDFVGRKQSRDWGTTRYARSLKEILGKEEARDWRQLGISRRALGADVHKLAVLQEARLTQVQAMTGEQVDNLMQKMVGATGLPKLAYYYQRHGALLGVSSQEEYLALFREHVQRTDLRIATALRPKDQTRMWYLIGMDNGAIAQYNKGADRFWTFFKTRDLGRYLEEADIWWIEATRRGETWSFEPWKRTTP